MLRPNSENVQLQDIKERFQNYIRNVKVMRSQLKATESITAPKRPEDEVTFIRGLYEEEIRNLQEKLGKNDQTQDGLIGQQNSLIGAEYQHSFRKSSDVIGLYRDDVAEVQDLLLVKMKELDNIQKANLGLRSELDVLKSLLEEEEEQ
ncbi:Hypothetical predicted protein [Pelobates cultripes]|nr:Hypothetical predicted protein [Pelobates cultripes]